MAIARRLTAFRGRAIAQKAKGMKTPLHLCSFSTHLMDLKSWITT